MVSQAAEYALRVVVYLGSQEGAPRTAAQISEAMDTDASYLTEIMEGLIRSGLVDSQRGLDDVDFRLIRDLDDLTVLDVVIAVDAFHRLENCLLGRPAETSGLCPLHRPMDDVLVATEQAVDQTTIGELLHEPNLLCSLPCIAAPVGQARG